MVIKNIFQGSSEVKDLANENAELKKQIEELKGQNRKNSEEMVVFSDTLKKYEEYLKKLTAQGQVRHEDIPAPVVPAPVVPEPTPSPKKSTLDIDDLKKEINHLSSEYNNSFKRIEDLLQDSVRKDRINKELHEELQKYKAGLRKEFITPLLKHIIHEYDRADKQFKFYLQNEQESSKGDLFVKLLKEFQMVSFALLDLLHDYDIDSFEVKEGAQYSAKEHKVVEVIETDDDSKNGTVASCETCGFRDIESGRLLQQANIKVYKKR
jgi:molecular chaperone GrpE (heat shock protein)